MTFPRLSAGLLCIIGTDVKGPRYRLVVPARFTFEAWVCRDERSGLVAVIPERILNPAPAAAKSKKKRIRPRFKLPPVLRSARPSKSGSFPDAPTPGLPRCVGGPLASVAVFTPDHLVAR